MRRDDLYATAEAAGPFRFSSQVVAVFEDMIRRSVPGYGLTLTAIEALAGRELPGGSRVYDLGSSLGAAVEAVWRGTRDREVEIHGIDSSAAMVSRARELLDGSRLYFHEGDVLTVPLEKSRMIILNFTLQFIAMEDRQALLEKCYQALEPGGVLFLSEKFVSENPGDEDCLRELHWEFKRQQGYSEMEVARKRQALEDVLIPETRQAHEDKLSAAGFAQVTQVLQCLNFASWVARK